MANVYTLSEIKSNHFYGGCVHTSAIEVCDSPNDTRTYEVVVTDHRPANLWAELKRVHIATLPYLDIKGARVAAHQAREVAKKLASEKWSHPIHST